MSSSFSLLPKMSRKEKSYERNLGRHKVRETYYLYYIFISKNIQSTISKQSTFLTSVPKTFRQLSNYQCIFLNFYLQSPVRDQDCVSTWPAKVTNAGVREHGTWCDYQDLVVKTRSAMISCFQGTFC